MCHFKRSLLLGFLGLLWMTSSAAAPGKKNACASQCSIARIHRLMSADCYNRTCRRFPDNIPSDIEVIDLTLNRITGVSTKDLLPYTSLKCLYLGDNVITKIQPDAFADKTSLIALDLSLNPFMSLASFPEVIFHLPSLKHLYLSQNHNINMVEVVEHAVPITAPLESFDFSYNNMDDEDYTPLPIMGNVPTLLRYNVTGMNLLLNTTQFAGLCNLEHWVNDNVTAMFKNECDCWNLKRWLKERSVKFVDFSGQCSGKEKACEYYIPQEDIDIFSSCKTVYAEQVFQTKLNKSLLIAGCVLGIILIVVIIIVWKWRRSKVRQRRQKQQIVYHDEIANLNAM